MKKLFLILLCAMLSGAASSGTMANSPVNTRIFTDYNIFAANNTEGFVAIYFTGETSGIRGYVAPGTAEMFGPIPGETYSVMIGTNLPGTHTYNVNGQTQTTSASYAYFTITVDNNVYITVN